MYLENYKTLIKESEDDRNKWKDILCSQEESMVKMTILPKAIYRFNTIPVKIPVASFTELEQIILKTYMEPQTTPNSQSTLERKGKAGSIMLPDFKL